MRLKSEQLLSADCGSPFGQLHYTKGRTVEVVVDIVASVTCDWPEITPDALSEGRPATDSAVLPCYTTPGAGGGQLGDRSEQVSHGGDPPETEWRYPLRKAHDESSTSETGYLCFICDICTVSACRKDAG
jgi:hypothetical protein